MVAPLLAAAIPAAAGLVGELFKGGGGEKGGSTPLVPGGKMISDVITDHPVTKGTDLPPILAAMMTDKLPSSGHVAAAASKLGKPGVLAPALEQALTKLRVEQTSEGVKTHQEKAGRAQVRRVVASTMPQLKQLNRELRNRANQIQATAEHKAIVDRDKRWRELLHHIHRMQKKLDRVDRMLMMQRDLGMVPKRY